jgi:tetratricopeptide (TPR) repeat protein
MAAVTSPPTAQAQEFIREAIGLVARGEPEDAARRLQSGFRVAQFLPLPAADIVCYADAVLRLKLMAFVTMPRFRACIRGDKPSLAYPDALLAAFPNPAEMPEGKYASYALLVEATSAEPEPKVPGEARELMARALDNFRRMQNLPGQIEAMHAAGRLHGLDNLDGAMEWYDQEVELARQLNDDRSVARAMHERARVFQRRDYDFQQAEEGYRHALRYYLDRREENNIEAAIKCLGQLGQEALWALDLSVRRTVEK